MGFGPGQVVGECMNFDNSKTRMEMMNKCKVKRKQIGCDGERARRLKQIRESKMNASTAKRPIYTLLPRKRDRIERK